MTDLFNYHPRLSHKVSVGNRPLGGEQPLRIQSMTTAVTTDTEACVKQCIAIFDAGADYVRLTTQERAKLRTWQPYAPGCTNWDTTVRLWPTYTSTPMWPM